MATLLEDLMKRKAGGFAPTAPTPDFQMQRPQVAPTPQVGPTIATEPQLSDGITFPGLDQIGAAGAAEFNAPQPDTYNAGTLGAPNFDEPYVDPQSAKAFEAARVAGETPREPTVGDNIMDNLAESRLGKYLGGMRTLDMDASGRVDPSTSTPVFKGLAERTGTEGLGADIPEVLPSPSPLDASPQSSAPAAATTSGLPVATPAPIAAAPTPTPTGGITRADGTFTPTQQPTGELAAYENRIATETKMVNGEEVLVNPPISQADVSAANAARGRPANVSTAEVAAAESQMAKQEAGREADRAAAEYGKTLSLGGESIGKRDEKIAKFREEFVAGQKEVKTRTPEQVQSDERKATAQKLEIERKQQVIDAGNQPDATPRQKKRGEWEEMQDDMEADGMSPAEIAARRKAFLYGDTFDPYQFEDNGGEDPTPTEGEATDAVDAKRARLEELRKKAGK